MTDQRFLITFLVFIFGLTELSIVSVYPNNGELRTKINSKPVTLTTECRIILVKSVILQMILFYAFHC